MKITTINITSDSINDIYYNISKRMGLYLSLASFNFNHLPVIIDKNTMLISNEKDHKSNIPDELLKILFSKITEDFTYIRNDIFKNAVMVRVKLKNNKIIEVLQYVQYSNPVQVR